VSQAGCVGSQGGRSSRLLNSRTRSGSSGCRSQFDSQAGLSWAAIAPATGHASRQRDRIAIRTAHRPAARRLGDAHLGMTAGLPMNNEHDRPRGVIDVGDDLVDLSRSTDRESSATAPLALGGRSFASTAAGRLLSPVEHSVRAKGSEGQILSPRPKIRKSIGEFDRSCPAMVGHDRQFSGSNFYAHLMLIGSIR
jgi:hypothetical protein